MKRYWYLCAVVAALACVSSASAFPIWPEAEANDTKATAQVLPACLNPADGLTGTSTSSSGVGVDYYRLTTCVDAPAIYEYVMTLSTAGTVGHTTSLRGVGQIGAVAGPWLPGMVVGTPNTTEASIQGHVIPAATTNRVQKWYGFGKGETQLYRVNGGTTTTVAYTSVLSRTTIVPAALGAFAPGSIEFTWRGQGHSTDTDMWMYDANLDPIVGYGNDDSTITATSGCTGAAATSLQSCLVRDYGPGTYYMAVSNWQTTNNQAAASDDNFRTGQMHESAGTILNNSATVNLNMAFAVTDANGTTAFAGTKTVANQVLWYTFTVTPEPASLSLLALGAVGLLHRRRR